MRHPALARLVRLTPLVAALSAPWLAVSAQANGGSSRPAAPTTGGATDPIKGKVLNLADYGRWNRITSTALSPDGRWMTYAYQPNEGDATLYVKQLDGDKIYTIPVGTEAAGGRGGGGGGFGGGGATGPQFSDDSRWVGYWVNPPERAAGGGGGRGGRGGGPPGAVPPGGRGATTAASGAAASRRFELLNLASGEKSPTANAASFKFSKGSRWLAVRLNKAQADAKQGGSDLIVRELSTGLVRNIGNVNLYEFDDAGRVFAYTVDAADRNGNGLYLLDPTTGETRALSTAAADYDQLAWSDEGANLAVLRGDKVKDMKQKANVLLAWTDAGSAGAKSFEFDPSRESFPKDFVLSEYTAPRWSKDGSRVFVGIKEQEPEVAAADSSKANVDVWHWRDAEAQSVQMVRLAQERRATYPGAVLLAGRKFVRLGDAAMRTVQPARSGTVAIGRDDAPYRGEVEWGANKGDAYRISTQSGERTLIEKGLSRTYGTSPDSKWFLYLKDKRVKAFNLETAKTVDVDAATPGKSFVDDEDDHPYEKPIYGLAGWTKDGHSVLLYDKYDVWQLPLDGGKAVNLTNGIGKAQQIVFRLVRLAAGGRGGRGGGGGRGGAPGGDDEEGLDLSRPHTLSAYGDRTKKTGYWQLTAGEAPKPLIWADKAIGQAQKAENADRVIFTEQTFEEFPDYWATNSAFETPKRITDANPFITEYAWGKKVLYDYTNSKGKKLQATLTLPAGYEPGKKYPMLVYFYEIMSNTHHQFSMPAFDDRPQMSTYASNGYLVLQPDVVYEIGRPGTSAVDCVTSAVKKAIELGYADPKHIGLQGHSWGGYQSSYIVTQTDLFAAVVTGAPPTNLISFYDELYKQTGTVQQGIMEVGQVRMGANVTPWNSHDLYEQQSPVYNVRNIKTPFLILQGTADGAVDWIEGLQFFNAARRNGKEVIFLSYPNENHHLAIKENQKDFQIRMKQFFDHYLMDKPAPLWMTEGVPQVKKGGPIR